MNRFTISISEPANFNACHHWRSIELSKWQDIAEIAIKFDVSVAVFAQKYDPKHAQRSAKNVIAFHPFLFFDIDNDQEGKKKPLSVQEAYEFMDKAKYPICFAIVPSRNYKKLKEKDKRPNIERFRIIVPLSEPISSRLIVRRMDGSIDTELYRAFHQQVAKVLGLADYADEAALKDMARYYAKHQTPPAMTPILIDQQKRLMTTKVICQRVIEKLKRERKEKQESLTHKSSFAKQKAILSKNLMVIQAPIYAAKFAEVAKPTGSPTTKLATGFEEKSLDANPGRAQSDIGAGEQTEGIAPKSQVMADQRDYSGDFPHHGDSNNGFSDEKTEQGFADTDKQILQSTGQHTATKANQFQEVNGVSEIRSDAKDAEGQAGNMGGEDGRIQKCSQSV
ncbi:hypothetical protein [Helicobacter sp. L8]|uniref:hypothetical protein n=1 Tax=Helicobacter sp. L8 TaxID=2316078 RepID=UPI000EAFF185|nr:hypothetical protein [Helicobacter sp. L8]